MILLAIFIIVLFVIFWDDGCYYGGLVWIDTPLWKKVFFSIVAGFLFHFIFSMIFMWMFEKQVFYETKAECMLTEIKSSGNDGKDNIFLVQSGSSYYYVSNDDLNKISLDLVDSINTEWNNTRKIKTLSPKFKKRWYQIVLFAFGPISFDEKYIIFVRNDSEIKRGNLREDWLFSY